MDDRQAGAPGETPKSWFRWVILGLSIPLSIYLCGQIAWLVRAPTEPVEFRSDLTADYSPWTSAFFPGLDPNVLLEALRDQNAERWSDAERAVNCFLLSSRCETAVPDEAIPVTPGGTPTQLRIANNNEPDFDQPDGNALWLQPGQLVVLDLRKTPILVSDDGDPEADIILFLAKGSEGAGRLDSLQISLGRKAEDDWTVIYARGDQAHGDTGLEMSYSMDDEAVGSGQNPATSSEDALSQPWLGFALDVDASITEPATYSWMQIVVMPDVDKPVGIDAIKVIEP